MKRSSSTIRPLKSASLNINEIDYKKTDNLPIIIPNVEKKPSKVGNGSKVTTSKSSRWFLFIIIFLLFMFGFILYKIFLTYTFSFTRREKIPKLKRNTVNYNSIYEKSVPSKNDNDPYANMLINQEASKSPENHYEAESKFNNNELYKTGSKKKHNFRKKMSSEELQLQYEYELKLNPALEVLNEQEIKEAIENGTIDQAVEEAEEIEEIVNELEELKREKRQKGFRGRNK